MSTQTATYLIDSASIPDFGDIDGTYLEGPRGLVAIRAASGETSVIVTSGYLTKEQAIEIVDEVKGSTFAATPNNIRDVLADKLHRKIKGYVYAEMIEDLGPLAGKLGIQEPSE